jgi:hypothetical protein
MKVPSNIIMTGKYTIGNEFVNKNTYESYQGYYYEFNNKLFSGKEFNINSPELIKIQDIPPLVKADKKYASLTKVNLSTITAPKNINKKDLSLKDTQGKEYYTYYAKKLNSTPVLIKQIDKETYSKLQNNSIWQVIEIITIPGDGFILEEELIKAEKQMPGIQTWIRTTSGAGSF